MPSPYPPSSSRPMASTSTSTSRSRRQRSDVFRPNLPLNPFSELREPYVLSPEKLWSLTTRHPSRQVLLVIGAPALKDLEPLLHSQHLADSLIILASHIPPELPPTVQPAVRIIRLQGPLAIENSGAVKFVNLLERAERIARIWRKKGGSGVAELPEDADLDTSFLSPPPSVFRFTTRSTGNSPQSSSEHLPTGRPRSLSARTLTKMRGTVLPSVDPFQRPFDAIFNFMPSDVPDKLLLKQTILVSTISHPFLSSSAISQGLSPFRAASRSLSSSRSSSFSRMSNYGSSHTPGSENTSRASLASTVFAAEPHSTKAHICHIIPSAHTPRAGRSPSKLVQGIESFLLSFGYPPRLETLERGIPYLLSTGSMAETLSLAANDGSVFEWSLAEVLVNGLLDPEDGDVQAVRPMTNDHTGYIAANQSKKAPRAWLTGSRDIVVRALPSPSLPSLPPPSVRMGKERAGPIGSSPFTPPPTPPSLVGSLPAVYSGHEGKHRMEDIPGIPTPPHSEESTLEDHRSTIELRKVPEDYTTMSKPLRKRESSFGFRKSWKFWSSASSSRSVSV